MGIKCRSCRIVAAMLILAWSFFLLTGCAAEDNTPEQMAVFTSLQDIPGITEEEIKAVEELRAKYDTFIFGALGSTEAFYDENGEIRGYSALFCEWLSELFGISFVPQLYEWGDLFPALKADFTGDLTETEERKANLGYMFTDPIAERSTKFFRISGSEPRSEIIKNRPLKLAFLEGSTTSRAAIAQLEGTSVPYTAVYINDYEAAYRMMKSGEVDAFIHEMVVEAAFDEMEDVVVEDFLPLIYEPVSLAAQNPELKPIIDIVQKVLENGGINHFADLYEHGMKEYARHKLFMRFDEQELTYLRENGSVAYLAEFDNYPLSFYNDNENEWQGIAPDILAEITALTGLTFEPINEPDTSFSDLMKMLEDGEGAMLSEVIHTGAREGRFLWPKNDTMRDNYVAISLEDMPNITVYRIMQLRVGIQTDTAYSDLFKTWFPSHPNVVEYNDVDSAFDGLEKGEVDILMYSMRNLLTATNYHERTGFKANIVFDYTFGSLFGFNKDEAVLCSIIDKAMDIVDNDAISSQWLRKTFDYRSKILESQRPFLIGVIMLFLIVIILILVLYLRNRNVGRQLDKLVRERTAELASSQHNLSAALKAAEMANRAKSAFLATMSHEIRTPLNAIIGVAQIQLQKEQLPKEYAEEMEKIFASGNNLLGIINDILDMSKIETGKLDLNPAEYDLPSLLNDAIQLNMVRIGSKPIEVILEIDEALPQTLYGDELRLKQILNNLFSNAIKYTEQGYVKISVSHKQHGEDVILCFTVEDTGQGIKPEDLTKLFSEYSRFNAEANRATEGTGLGLSIAKRLVEMMDGTIEVSSEYGKGSVFTVYVRQKNLSGEPIGAELAQSLRNLTFIGEKQMDKLQTACIPMPYGKVLVVDDVEANLYVAQGLLSTYKLQIDKADSGFAVINRVEKGEIYDIIFMDHMMPQMDGIETTQKLRASGYQGAIVALTANALTGNDKMFSQNGFDDFISKPIDVRKLDMVLHKYVHDRYPEQAAKYQLAMEGGQVDREGGQGDSVAESAMVAESAVVTEAAKAAASPSLLKIFCRDAQKAIQTLGESASSGDLKLLATTAHAMKPVLDIIGEQAASGTAADLENAGKNGDTAFIGENLDSFIATLERLIAKYRPQGEEIKKEAVKEDMAYLTEQLRIIEAACMDYDDAAAYASLDKLAEKPWNAETAAALEEIREMLFLHSDFEAAAARAKVMLDSREDK